MSDPEPSAVPPEGPEPAGAAGGAGRARPLEALPLTLVLFAFWVVLSGKLDAFHLIPGAACSAGVALWTQRLLDLPPRIGIGGAHPLVRMPWPRFVGVYLPWLVWQVVIANLQVLRIVLSPALPIRPRMVRFERPLPHPLARLTLANSITLTPGTVTIDLEDDVFLVHALTDEHGDSLDDDGQGGDMGARVAGLFDAAPGSTAGGDPS